MSSTIVLSRVHIKNIRSIRECTLNIGKSNYVFGPNDSGKSNLLYALELALTNRRLMEDDVYKPLNENDSSIIVDLMFTPAEGNSFDKIWLDELDMPSIGPSGEFFAFRTAFQYDPDNDIYRKSRRRINVWDDDITVAPNAVVSDAVMELFGCYNIDAHRDLSEDLMSRQSLWNRKLSSVDVPDDLRERYTNDASEFNRDIIRGSKLLSDLSDALDSVPTEGKLFIDTQPIDVEAAY